MTFDEYQKAALVTAVFSGDELHDLCHWALGVSSEAGEIAGKTNKIIRDHGGHISNDTKTEMAKEIGDVLWYLAALAEQLGVSFDDIAAANLAKLRSRHDRSVIAGSGDNR